jgi:8-oxo-dGTP pyrophosphatase MutT (NUDIX family)
MPHIHTGPGQHDITASAFIVRLDTPEPTIMLHLHKLLGKYLQFGGHVELHETPWQAVTHELREESGYDIDQLEIYQPKNRLVQLSGAVVHPIPSVFLTVRFKPDMDHYHTDIEYAVVANEAPRNQVAEGESSIIRLYTRNEIALLSNEDIFEDVREICLYILDTIVNTHERVAASKFSA